MRWKCHSNVNIYLFVFVVCWCHFCHGKWTNELSLGSVSRPILDLKVYPCPQPGKTLAKALPKRTKEGLCPHLTFGFTFTSSSLCFHTCYQNVNQYFIMINLCWFQSLFLFLQQSSFTEVRWIVPSILRKCCPEGLFFSFLTSRWPWILESSPETLFSESRYHSDKVD